jgi:predicted Rossmann-fold nucleotide-binding protein
MTARTQHRDGGRKRIIAFVSSSTSEKARHLQAIANDKKFPITFILFDRISTLTDSPQESGTGGIVTSAPEDGGTFARNAMQKVGMTAQELLTMPLEERERRLRKLCQMINIEFDKDRIFYCVEDGGLSMHPRLWKKITEDTEFRSECPEHLLESVRKEAGDAGPGPETAGVLSAALGPANLMKYVEKAIRALYHEVGGDKGKLPSDLLEVKENAHLTFTNVFNPAKTASMSEPITATYHWNIENGDTLTAHPDPRNRPRSTYHYMIQPHVDITCASIGQEFLTRYHPRVEALRQAYNKLGVKGLTEYSQQTALRNYPLYAGLIGKTTGLELDELRHRNIICEPLRRRSHAGDKSHAGHEEAVHILSDIHPLIQRNDALVIMPAEQTSNQLADRFRNRFILDSIMVAQQTDPRHYLKPVLIVDDNSWEKDLKLHNELIAYGLTKDHVLPWTPEMLLGKSNYTQDYRVNQYLHVLRWNDREYGQKFHAAVQQWLDLHLQKKDIGEGFYVNYGHKQEDPVPPSASTIPHTTSIRERAGKDDSGISRMNVAVFCSASSQNKRLTDMTRELTYDLASHGYGVVYGGADQYMMGEIREGVLDYRLLQHDKAQAVAGANRAPDAEVIRHYREEYDALVREKNEIDRQKREVVGYQPDAARESWLNTEIGKYDKILGDESKSYIAGVSTPQLVKKETVRGKGPTNIHYIEVPDIYQRIAIMAQSSDAFVIGPGGAGTLQELDALLYLKALNHPSMMASNSHSMDLDKPIIIVNPEIGLKNDHEQRARFWDKSIKLMFGKKAAAIISKPLEAGDSLPSRPDVDRMWKNVFVVNSVQEAEKILERHYKHGHAPQFGRAA